MQEILNGLNNKQHEAVVNTERTSTCNCWCGKW